MVGSDLVVLWGINASYAHINLMSLVKRARKRGAFMVCIDPYRTQTAKTADLYLQPRPGTDGVLALRMMRVLIEEGLVDHEHIHLPTVGYGGDRNLLSRARDDPRRNAGRDPAHRSKSAPEGLFR